MSTQFARVPRFADLDAAIARGHGDFLPVMPAPLQRRMEVLECKSSAFAAEWRPAALLALESVWARRACFVCEKCGPCRHRELAVDLAEMEAAGRRLKV
jgi:hypothetical protein